MVGTPCLFSSGLAPLLHNRHVREAGSPTCTRCGEAWRSTRGDHPFKEAGLSHVTLVNVEFRECGCGERTVVIPRIEELHGVVARTVARAPLRPLKFARFRTWREVTP